MEFSLRRPLIVFDERQEIPAAEEWRKLESRIVKIERLGNSPGRG